RGEEQEVDLHARLPAPAGTEIDSTRLLLLHSSARLRGSNPAASASTASTKRSSVARSWASHASRPGSSPERSSSAATVPSPARSTITSNIAGRKAGKELKGLPPTLSGQST